MQRRLHVKPFFKTPNALFKIWTHNSRTRLNSTITFCNNTLKLNSRQKLPASKHSYYTLASWLKKRSLKWSQKQKLKHHVWAVGEMLLCTVCVCVCDGGAKLLMDTDNRVPTVFQLLLTTGKNLTYREYKSCLDKNWSALFKFQLFVHFSQKHRNPETQISE